MDLRATETVGIFFRYNGSWVTNGENCSYEGGDIKGRLVSRNATFDEIIDLVYAIVGADRNQYNVTLKYAVTLSIGSVKHLQIRDNDDVQFFIEHSRDVISSTKAVTPLLCSLERREVKALGQCNDSLSAQCSNAVVDAPVRDCKEVNVNEGEKNTESKLNSTNWLHQVDFGVAEDMETDCKGIWKNEQIDYYGKTSNKKAMKRKRISAEGATKICNKDEHIQEMGPCITDIPNQILLTVLLKLPTKSILMCKCVCKNWLGLISHPKFAKLHFAQAEVHPLVRPFGPTRVSRTLYLVEPEDSDGFDLENRACLSNYGWDKPRVHMKLAKYKIPLRTAEVVIQNHGNVNEMLDSNHGNKRKLCIKVRRNDHKYNLVNSCNGFLCLSEPVFNDPVVVCNPITGEFINLPQASKHVDEKLSIDCGFGFSPKSKEYKVIRLFNQETSEPNRVAELHTLGTAAWKAVGSAPDSRDKLAFTTYVKGVLYWLYSARYDYTILSFDLNTEKFQSFLLPFRLLPYEHVTVSIGVLGGCLCLCDAHIGDHINVWEMKDSGAQNPWAKKISFHIQGQRWPSGIYKPIKYLKNGDLLMFNVRTSAFINYRQNRFSYKYLKLRGVKSNFEAIGHVPSLISLKDILVGKDVEVLNINSRCAGFKLLGETKAVTLEEESADIASNFYTSSDYDEE